MAIEVPQNKKNCGGGKNGGRKGIGSAIRPRRANRGSIDIKKREQGEFVQRDVDLFISRVGMKRRKRGGRQRRISTV